MQHQEELVEKTRLMERELKALGDGHPEVRDKLMKELRVLHEHMKSLDHEHTNLNEAQELAKQLQLNREYGAQIERRLKLMNDPASTQARVLEDQLSQIDEAIADEEKELEYLRSKRHEEELRDLQRQNVLEPSGALLEMREKRRIAQERQSADREELLRQAHEGLTAHIRMTEERLKAAVEQDRPDAERLRRVLKQLHERREPLEHETDSFSDIPRERPGIENEVEELRGKVNGMHEEITQMREMLQQILEQTRKQPPKLLELGTRVTAPETR